VLFAAAEASFDWTNAQVAVQADGTGERRNLIQGATYPRYSPPDTCFTRRGRPYGVPFDPQRLEVMGAAVPVVEGVLLSRNTGAAQYSFLAMDRWFMLPEVLQEDRRRLVWVNRNGAEQPVAAPARAFMFVRLSPDADG